MQSRVIRLIVWSDVLSLSPAKEGSYETDDSNKTPTTFFKSKILLNSVPLDNTSDIESFCKNPHVLELQKEWDRKAGFRLNECRYFYPDRGCFHRYTYLFHKLYVYDYEKMHENKVFGQNAEKLSFEPFFSYLMKLDSQTGCMHSFGMGYDIYSDPYGFKIMP